MTTFSPADIELICRPADANGRRPVVGAPNLVFDLVSGAWLDNGEPLLDGQLAYLVELASRARANGHREAQNGHYGAVGGDAAQETITADMGQNSAALSVADSLRFFHPETPFEIRILGAKERSGFVVKTTSGYFDDPEQAATAVKSFDGRGHIYFTLNPVNPDLLARAYNRLEKNARATTSDSDITGRRWLIVDVDPERASGISATADELQEAQALIDEVEAYLPWQPAARAMSGNGYHLLYRVDMPNDDASSDLIQKLLAHLAERFDNEAARVDKTMFNASRITKLYGCLAVKGDNLTERPHRRAGLYPTGAGDVVTPDMIRAMLPEVTPGARPGVSGGASTYTGGGYDADAIRAALGRVNTGFTEKNKGGRIIFSLGDCLTSSDHSDGACITLVTSGPETGKAGYLCQHNSCQGKDWQSVKGQLFPGGATSPVTTQPATASANGAVAIAEQLPDLPLAEIGQALNQGEYGDGLLFGRLYDGRIKFDHSDKYWWWWAGHYWQPDKTQQTKRLFSGQLASQYLRAIATCNVELKRDDLDEKQKAFLEMVQKEAGRRANRLQQRRGRDAAMDYASSVMGIDGSQWDANLAGKLPVANGIVDMATGKLSPGKPGGYVRTFAPHPWEDGARVRFFADFLQGIFDGDAGLIAFVQRWLGYAASGRAIEHKLPVCWGNGRNGKDTLFEAVGYALGPLACAVSRDVFLDPGGRRTAGSAAPHLMALRGLRLGWGSEPSDGQRLDAAQVKAATGGGRLRARGLYGNEVEWSASHALALLTNHKPQAPADDFALWQRLLLIPFTQTFVANPGPGQHKADPNLLTALRKEAGGILAWLVDGYRDYLDQGLNPPAVVVHATQEYQEGEDKLKMFIEECCIVGASYTARAGDLYATYRAWAERGGLRPLSTVKFAEKMTGKGYQKERKPGVGYVEYSGIGLLAQPE